MKILKIGSVEIPARSSLDIDQTYEPLGGETILRTLSGAGIKQATWQKTRTVISGGGWIPPGLTHLDYTTQQSVACIVPRALICNGSRMATLPAARRADTGYEPWAWALMPDGSVIASEVTIVSHVATVAAVTDAIGYQVLYYPLLTCWCSRPNESGSRGEATYRWELIAEEV